MDVRFKRKNVPKKIGSGGIPVLHRVDRRAPARPKEDANHTASPLWNNNVKLIIGFTIIAIVAGLLIRFRTLVGPLLVAFILAFLFQPIAKLMQKKLKMSWRLAVTLIYLFVLLILLATITAGSFALVDQITRLVNFVSAQIQNIPDWFAEITSKSLKIGPFQLDLSQYQIEDVGNQVLEWVNPIVSQIGNFLKAVATGAANTIGWTFFALLVSYFVLAETDGAKNQLIKIKLPGYADDVRKIGRELGNIWNSFLRGQIIIVLITIVVYDILLGGLGVNFFFGLAFLAGIARFVPYVGPAIAWAAYGLVAYFQGTTIFGLTPFFYVLLVVGLAWLTDVILDNFVVPRLMSDALSVHPAAVMVAALVSAQLFGVIGVVMAAPVLATFKLILDYAMYKLFDQDPWQMIKPSKRKKNMPLVLKKIGSFGEKLINNIKRSLSRKAISRADKIISK